MDKTLEIIMVAVALVVAAVIVVSMLQGRTGNVADFADNQTSDSNCGLNAQRLASSIDCNNPPSDSDIESMSAYSDQCWDNGGEAESQACG